MIKAVTFDHWNTLVHEDTGALRERRLDAWVGIMEDVGFAVERKLVDAAFASSWARFTDAWETGSRQYTAVEAAADILDELGYAVPADVHEKLIEAFTHVGETRLHLSDGLVECWSALKDSWVKLCIVCDVGMTP